MMNSLVIFFLVFPSLLAVSASTDWSDLRVSWPKFTGLPLTATDAKNQGWMIDADKTCTSGSAMGTRMYLPSDDNPLSTFLLFNQQGHISGVQGASTTQPPLSTLSPEGPWLRDTVTNTTLYTLTMYFRDPTTICTGNDSGAKIGDGLWFVADGVNATSLPQNESDLPLGPGTWGKGKCFATMGNHYWFNLSPTAPCDPLLPLFLLYNKGQLNGFGWALSWGAAQPGSRWEHPTTNVLGLFFADGQQPTCFQDKGRIFSTMHFYLSSPLADFC